MEILALSDCPPIKFGCPITLFNKYELASRIVRLCHHYFHSNFENLEDSEENDDFFLFLCIQNLQLRIKKFSDRYHRPTIPAYAKLATLVTFTWDISTKVFLQSCDKTCICKVTSTKLGVSMWKTTKMQSCIYRLAMTAQKAFRKHLSHYRKVDSSIQ